MKKLFLILISVFVQSLAHAKVPVSIAVFENKTADSHCRNGTPYYWHRSMGDAFREMLEHSLAKNSQIQILERKEINRVYNQEHELINSSNASKAKKGEFKQAKYSLVGTVTEFELCDSDSGASVDVGEMIGFGSLKVGGSTGQAKVAVIIKIVDVETGEVVKTVEGEGFSKASSADFKVAVSGVRTGFGGKKNSPMNKAAKEAINQATPEILEALKI